MTNDEIISMAREAGVCLTKLDSRLKYFEHFAALVAAAEREACAELCDSEQYEFAFGGVCANVIRVMGKK